LFNPTFIEIDGSVLHTLNGLSVGEEFIAAKRNHLGNVMDLERSFNLFEISYAFIANACAIEDHTILALTVAECWRAHLRNRYPSRQFMVDVVLECELCDGVGLDFYEVRDVSTCTGTIIP
jgi:hypothetical protein